MENEENSQSQNQNIQDVPPADNQAAGSQSTENAFPIQPQAPQQPTQPQQAESAPVQPQPQIPSQPQYSQIPQIPAQENVAPATESAQPKLGKSYLLLIIGLILLAAAIIIGVASFFMNNKNEDPKKDISNTASAPINVIKQNTPTPNPTANWKAAATKYYTIKYPPESDLNTQENTINISYWGPTQTKDTELFDGYSITIEAIETPQSPEEYANTLIAEVESSSISEIMRGSEPVTINGYEGVTYIEEGLGTYKNYVLGADNSSVLIQISVLVADPRNLGFQDTVDNILSTLEFIPGV